MDRKILFIHGLGDQQKGYSQPWQDAFNAYLGLPPLSYIEVLWADIFQQALAGQPVAAQRAAAQLALPAEAPAAATAPAAPATPTPAPKPQRARRPATALTPAQQVAAARITAEITARLQARSTAQVQVEAARAPQPAGATIADSLNVGNIPIVGGIVTGLTGIDSRIGEFVTYLVNPTVRAAVKQRFKDPLLTLAGSLDEVTIIAHSWGTVIAYDALLDLQTEAPNLQVAHLFTLGCPLWLVQSYLQDTSGRKPGELTLWTNVFARGDMIGSWLAPGYTVDKEFEVPNFGGQDPHGSYFLDANEEVQRDLVAQLTLRGAPAPVVVPAP